MKLALEQAIRLRPLHAEAHICLGAFHAEVIDTVGPLIGNMTYGARKDVSLALFQRSLSLTPQSAIAQMEYANALVMLEGDDGMAQATQLYEQAANSQARDAMEHLDRELAQTMLGN